MQGETKLLTALVYTDNLLWVKKPRTNKLYISSGLNEALCLVTSIYFCRVPSHSLENFPVYFTAMIKLSNGKLEAIKCKKEERDLLSASLQQ